MPLLLVTPDAEPLVGRWREEHDWAASFGIPSHVTVRSPFLPRESWDANVAAALGEFLPVPVTLARLDHRPGAIVILVEPDGELRRLTMAATAAWPTLPPHKDGRLDVAYHITVVRTRDSALRRRAWREIEPQLPLGVLGTELWAAEGSRETGATHTVVARASTAA